MMGSLQICNIGNDILILNFISGYAYEVSRLKSLLFLLHGSLDRLLPQQIAYPEFYIIREKSILKNLSFSKPFYVLSKILI